MDSATIAAIATPIGKGGIGIVRISGPSAFSIVGRIFKKSRAFSSTQPDASENAFPYRSHRFYHGYIISASSGTALDEVLMVTMAAPRSYTKEDVVEIHTHSGPAVLDAVLGEVLKHGARLAEPGEFTRRAFVNGRIDLTQAEAVVDLINSRTRTSLRMASVQLSGEMRKILEKIQQALLHVQVDVESAIDFPDDDRENAGAEDLSFFIQTQILDPLQKMLNQYEGGHVYRDGFRLAVVGKPNVGKSSLMNRLLRKNRAIVSDIPGTTRDFIEDTLTVGDIPVVVTDTAGIHETDDPIEMIGIEKTRAVMAQAELVLFMVDSSRPLEAADHQIAEQMGHQSVILVMNKSDLVRSGQEIVIPESWGSYPKVKTSALKGRGVAALEKLIVRTFTGPDVPEMMDAVVPNQRQKQALERTLAAAVSIAQGVAGRAPCELVAIDVRQAMNALGEIIGTTTHDALLDKIFSRFCIGK